MILEMLVTKEILLPPSGKVTYPAGACVNVDNELALQWLDERPRVAIDPDNPPPPEEPKSEASEGESAVEDEQVTPPTEEA